MDDLLAGRAGQTGAVTNSRQAAKAETSRVPDTRMAVTVVSSHTGDQGRMQEQQEAGKQSVLAPSD